VNGQNILIMFYVNKLIILFINLQVFCLNGLVCKLGV